MILEISNMAKDERNIQEFDYWDPQATTPDEEQDPDPIPYMNSSGRGKTFILEITDIKLPLVACLDTAYQTRGHKLHGKGRSQIMRERVELSHKPGSMSSHGTEADRASVLSSCSSLGNHNRFSLPEAPTQATSYHSTSPTKFGPRPVKPAPVEGQFADSVERYNVPPPNPFGKPTAPLDLTSVEEFPDLASVATSAATSTRNHLVQAPSVQNVADILRTDNKNSIGEHNDKASSSSKRRLEGQNVIYIENLPVECKEESLVELVQMYGTVVESYFDTTGAEVRMSTEEECKWVMSCLHDQEDLVPGSTSQPLICRLADQNLEQ